MSQMLASDLNNPAFVGAMNPNSLLHVEFYWHEPEDWNKTQETGKLVRLPKQIYVRIMRPGDNTSIVETPIREEHKAGWPDKWLYFQMKEGLIEGGGDIPGWKVEEWNFLNPEQVRELKFLRFSTVEQIAGASDAQVQKLGIGGLGLREQARQALRARMGAETRDAMAEKDHEIAEMKARMERLEALLLQPTQAMGHKVENNGVSDLVVKVAQPVVEMKTYSGYEILEHKQPEPATTERDSLVAQYVQKFGKKPHHKLGVEKIKAALS